jgi:ribosome-binding factor A
MKRKRLSTDQVRQLCGELGEEDGVDPRHLLLSQRASARTNRKAMQLCGQVAETLNLVFSGEARDEVLRELQVAAVVPAPHTAQLLVMVEPAIASPRLHPERVAEHLVAKAGMLRAAVAASITRRRAPKLLFQFRPSSAEPR